MRTAGWSHASTLEHLCGLTAAWLRGDIAAQPGCGGSVDVDEEEAPGLTEALIAANEAGFLTRSSQAGFDGLGYDGAHWTQLASFSGFATEAALNRLIAAPPAFPDDDIEYQIAWHSVGKWRAVKQNGVIVTRRNGKRATTFGNQLAARYIRSLFEDCPQAWPALYEARQFVIWDPQPGRNTLWADLTAALKVVA